MFRDPIVEEVRAIREQLAAQFDFDIRRIVEDAQRRQAASKSRVVSFQREKKSSPPLVPAPAVSENIPSPQADSTSAL